MVLSLFFLQANEDLSVPAWTSILHEDFKCVSPITPFRSFPPAEVSVPDGVGCAHALHSATLVTRSVWCMPSVPCVG